jgi:hypothetical protein
MSIAIRNGVHDPETAARDRKHRPRPERDREGRERLGRGELRRRDADEAQRAEEDQVREDEICRNADRAEEPALAQDREHPGAELRTLPGAVLDRIALDLHEEPGERPLCLRSEPARRIFSTQEGVSGEAGDRRDRERETAREPHRPADLARHDEQRERHYGKHEPADRGEDE